MGRVIANIWTFNTGQFRITVDALEDFDVDLSFDEDGEVRRKLETGALTSFTVHARCVHTPTGCEGEDYLGGCIYASPEEFRDHIGINEKSRRDGRNYGSYFTDMVRSAITECRDRCEQFPTLRQR